MSLPPAFTDLLPFPKPYVRILEYVLTYLAARRFATQPGPIPLRNYRDIQLKLQNPEPEGFGFPEVLVPATGACAKNLALGCFIVTGDPGLMPKDWHEYLDPGPKDMVTGWFNTYPQGATSTAERISAVHRACFPGKHLNMTALDPVLTLCVNHMLGTSIQSVTTPDSVSTPTPDKKETMSTPAQSFPSPDFIQKETMSTPPATPTPSFADALGDPEKLGKLIAAAVQAQHETPVLKSQVATLKTDLSAAYTLNAAHDMTIKDLEAQVSVLKSKASTAYAPKPTDAGQTNDLDKIAHALHIDRATLDTELAAFVTACSLPMSNAVQWADWCNPNEKLSPLPFLFRQRKPVFLSGSSGSGKTFLAEALAVHEQSRRCCVTFHEKLSYAKLFIRDTVKNGQVRGVLGPVLMACLTGTPFIADEIDHAEVFVQSLLHELLDKRRVLIPELAMSIIAEPGCAFIATGNSLTDDTGAYHGEVGTALRTRFACIHVPYPTEQQEADTIHTASTCSKPLANIIAKTFEALRIAEQDNKLAGPFSVRESCAVGALTKQALAAGWKESEALAVAFKTMVTEKRPPSEQQTAGEIIQTLAGVSTTTFIASV